MTSFKKIFSIGLSLFTGLCASHAETDILNGSWEGKLEITPQVALRLVINIADADSASPTVTMDSPDQGAYGLPMHVNILEQDSLNVTVSELRLQYEGRLTGDSIKGNFSQGPLSLPLVLRPKTTSLNRPQTPKPPFLYTTEEVSFSSAGDGAPLFGTLTLPNQDTNASTAVIFVSGSGTQNRDEEIFEHKPFAVIADFLARGGIASLRYDDRGFDMSKGLAPNSTTLGNALDALGGIEFLKQWGFDKVGIIGHSEGGLVADMLAAEGNSIDFVIELGGPAVPGDSILIYQNRQALLDGGLPDEYISLYLDALKGILDSQKDRNPKKFNEDEYEIFSSRFQSNPVTAPLAQNLKDTFFNLNPWLRYFINYDPIEDIKKIKVPLLMIYGENDTQVPPSLNMPIILSEAPDVTSKVYPGLNHLLQHSQTGKVTEYASIEETISPEVLDDILSFILSIR